MKRVNKRKRLEQLNLQVIDHLQLRVLSGGWGYDNDDDSDNGNGNGNCNPNCNGYP